MTHPNTNKPMTVEAAIEALKLMRKDAVLVINGGVVLGIKPLNGKVSEGYFGPVFETNLKGDPAKRYQGVTFTHFTERSDGEVEETHYW